MMLAIDMTINENQGTRSNLESPTLSCSSKGAMQERDVMFTDHNTFNITNNKSRPGSLMKSMKRKDVYEFDEDNEFEFEMGSLIHKPSRAHSLGGTSEPVSDDHKDCMEATRQLLENSPLSSVVVKTCSDHASKRKIARSSSDDSESKVESTNSFNAKKRKDAWTEEHEKWFQARIDELLTIRSISREQMIEILEDEHAGSRLQGFLESVASFLNRKENSLLKYMRAFFQVAGYEKIDIGSLAAEEDSQLNFSLEDAQVIQKVVLSYCNNEGVDLQEFGFRMSSSSLRHTNINFLYNELRELLPTSISRKGIIRYLKEIYKPLDPKDRNAWEESELKKLYTLVEQEGTRWNSIANKLGTSPAACMSQWRFVVGTSTQETIDRRKLWTNEEEAKLLDLVKSSYRSSFHTKKMTSLFTHNNHTTSNIQREIPASDSIAWHSMSKKLGTKSPESCRKQYEKTIASYSSNQRQEEDQGKKRKKRKKKKSKGKRKFYVADSLKLLEHVQRQCGEAISINAIDWKGIVKQMPKWSEEELRAQATNLVASVRGWKKTRLSESVRIAITDLKSLPPDV
uniref:Myb-like domain-containing protein n=1 Tax=Schizosaccharomyces pombe TaxID=4896 RepID=Q1L858_SCHPM|nr:hypothetical protein [Schizosaccharomyces pombe]